VENAEGDNIKWERNSFNSFEGDFSVKLDNYNNEPDNTDALVTNFINVNRAAAMNFSFRYAVASKPGSAMDDINVSVSQDCGESWQSVRTLIGPLLYAATNKATPWNPTTSSNWRKVTIGLDNFVGNQPIMIKVAFTSGGGNNAFLDDFNLDVTLDQEDLNAAQISIYPNPRKRHSKRSVGFRRLTRAYSSGRLLPIPSLKCSQSIDHSISSKSSRRSRKFEYKKRRPVGAFFLRFIFGFLVQSW
jgi:hypothetical protein